MTIQIKKLNKKEVNDLLENGKVINSAPKEVLESIRRAGWEIHDYHIERLYKGYTICIEFGIGQFDVAIYSKKNKWVLEPKKEHENFTDALFESLNYQMRIDQDEHWTGEND